MSAAADPRLMEMTQRARQWLAAGRHDEAARAFEQVLAVSPRHPEALVFLGQQRLQTGDARAARDLFQRAVQAAPHDPIAAMNLSFAARALGDAQGEMTALDAALAADPYCYPALLGKGGLLERLGQTRKAAHVYRDALKIVPPAEQLAPPMRAAVEQAKACVAGNIGRFDGYAETRLAALRRKHAGADTKRFDEAKAAMAGRTKIFRNTPSLLDIPYLPPLAFYDDRSQFPWLDKLEAATDAIREELLGLIKARFDKFRPYVHYGPGVPLNQWEELNNNSRWSVDYLWHRGIRDDEVCALCPRTVEALSGIPFSTILGTAPDILFSALQPHTRIPAHTGVTNARLLCHLPLIIPENCGFRVGNDVRQWQEGKAWVFDDTMEHEAWNESDRLRVIMIFEIWHPALSLAERDMIAALIETYFAYEDADGGPLSAP